MIGNKKFLSNSFIYIIGVCLNQGVNFLTLFILARLLSPADYGFITLYGLWVNICLAFIALQGLSSVNNALIEYGEEKLNSYVFSISLLSIIVCVVTIGIVFVFKDVVQNIVGFPTYVIVMLTLQAAVSSFAFLQLEKNRVLKKACSAIIWTSSIPVLRLCLSVLLVIYVFNYSYPGDIYGYFLAAIVVGSVAIIKIIMDARFKFDFEYVKFCLPISIPIIFHSVSNLVLSGTGIYMLSRMLNESETGIYGFVYNISLIPTGVWFAINNAWSVEYFEKLKNNEIESIKALTHTYIRYMFSMYVIILLLIPELVYIIAPPDYHSGILYASYIMAAGFLTFLYTLCSRHELYAKKTIYIPIATATAAIINIGLNFIMIPRYGAFGAAISAIISFSVLFLMHYTSAGIIIKGFPIKFFRLAIPAALVICLSVLVNLLVDYMLIRLLLATTFGGFSLFSFIRYVKNGSRNKKMTPFTPQDHAFVICAYKENPYLPECLESLLTQSCKSSISMITSTPNDYIKNLCEQKNIPLFINTGEKGLAQDWNFAYEKVAEKKLITIAHQDDIYEPDYLETVLALVNNSKTPLIAYTEYYEIRNEKRISSNKLLKIKQMMNFPFRFRIFQRSRGMRRFILAFGDPVCCPAVTYVRENLPMPVFDTSFTTACDYKALVDISPLYGDFLYSPKKLNGHRIYPGSATSANIINKSKAQEDFIVFSSLWPKWIAKILSRQYQKAEKSNEITE